METDAFVDVFVCGRRQAADAAPILTLLSFIFQLNSQQFIIIMIIIIIFTRNNRCMKFLPCLWVLRRKEPYRKKREKIIEIRNTFSIPVLQCKMVYCTLPGRIMPLSDHDVSYGDDGSCLCCNMIFSSFRNSNSWQKVSEDEVTFPAPKAKKMLTEGKIDTKTSFLVSIWWCLMLTRCY